MDTQHIRKLSWIPFKCNKHKLDIFRYGLWCENTKPLRKDMWTRLRTWIACLLRYNFAMLSLWSKSLKSRKRDWKKNLRTIILLKFPTAQWLEKVTKLSWSADQTEVNLSFLGEFWCILSRNVFYNIFKAWTTPLN